MKRIFLYIVFSFFIISCTNKDEDSFMPSEAELVSKWKLIEMYSDPGDGSGDFEPVSSNKTVSFYSDDVIASNGDLCIMGTNTTNGSFGSYTMGSSNTITPSSCAVDLPFGITYTINNSTLILYYPCIEACAEKYELIEQ